MTRRRYRFNEETQALEEIGLDVELAPRVHLQTDTAYDGLKATDGTPIDTRRKHREYMQANNLTMVSDFTKTWAEAPAKRAAESRAELRRTLERTTNMLIENPKAKSRRR